MATLEEIIKASEGIRDATEVGENTATRVGGVFCDMAALVSSLTDDVKSLQTEALAVLDISKNYSALDFGLSADKDKMENFKTYSAIKEGIYLLKKDEGSHIELAPETDNYMIVGVMFVFKDGMKHCLQELVLTNELITSSTGTGHVDNYTAAKFRAWQNYFSPHTPKNSWGEWQNYIDTLLENMQLSKGIIQGSFLADASISAKKLQDNAITTSHIQDGAITAQKIEDEAVGTTKLQDNAVTMDKLEPDLQQAINEIPELGETLNAVQTTANATASKVEEWKESFETKELCVNWSNSIVGGGKDDVMAITIDGTSIGISKETPMDIFELNGKSAFFGSVEIEYAVKNPNISWGYFTDDGDDYTIAILGDSILLQKIAQVDAMTEITASGITTPKLIITDGTSSQLLLANGDLAETITTDDINALFN